jgi:hypothetical protein
MTTVTTPAPIAEISPDADILRAWERRKAAFKRYNSLPMDVDTDPTFDRKDHMTDAERAEWAVIDAAEAEIVTATATTPSAIAAQLWTALSHTLSERRHDEAAQKGDLAAMLTFEGELEWTERLILSALRSLNAMEASHGRA